MCWARIISCLINSQLSKTITYREQLDNCVAVRIKAEEKLLGNQKPILPHTLHRKRKTGHTLHRNVQSLLDLELFWELQYNQDFNTFPVICDLITISHYTYYWKSKWVWQNIFFVVVVAYYKLFTAGILLTACFLKLPNKNCTSHRRKKAANEWATNTILLVGRRKDKRCYFRTLRRQSQKFVNHKHAIEMLLEGKVMEDEMAPFLLL